MRNSLQVRKSIPGRGNSKCEGPEAGTGPGVFKTGDQEASVAEASNRLGGRRRHPSGGRASPLHISSNLRISENIFCPSCQI